MYADCLPGASVKVRVNGMPLTEHATENGDLSATTFVEAIAGANFAVILHLEDTFTYRQPADRIKFEVFLDGERAGALVVDPASILHATAVIDYIYETSGGRTTRRKFLFAELETSDGAAEPSLSKKLASVGEIKVELQRCRDDGVRIRSDEPENFKGIGDAGVPEKALKGRSVSNRVKLGPSEFTQDRMYANVIYPYGQKPIATFVFQYRSHRDLEIEGIIERAPSPGPLIDRDPAELTPDELREQNRLLRERRPTVNIKKEFKREKRARQRSVTLSNDDEGGVTITSVNNKRQRTRESMENAEVIDISDD